MSTPEDFAGFTIPQAAALPPELLAILPQIKSLAALKVLLIAIAELSRPGHEPQPLTTHHLQLRTGLSRQAIITARNSLQHWTVRDGNTITLRVAGVQSLDTSPQPTDTATPRAPTPSVSKVLTPTVDDEIHHLTLTKKQQQQFLALKAFGVMPHIARTLARKHDADTIDKYLTFAKSAKWARNPAGLLVKAITEHWDLPVIAPPKTWYDDLDPILR